MAIAALFDTGTLQRLGTAQALVGALLLLVYAAPAVAEEEAEVPIIVQARGVDQTVDYASLRKYGPWDDRNYSLTAEDLKYLSSDEHALDNQLPAFFRVELRKEMPHLRKSGPAQYPRSALQLFEQRHGGLKYEPPVVDESVTSPPDSGCGRARTKAREQHYTMADPSAWSHEVTLMRINTRMGRPA